MISINRVYEAVQHILNKDQRSSIKPAEFNSFSAVAMTDVIDEAKQTVQKTKYWLSAGRQDKEYMKYVEELFNQFYVPPTSISKSGDEYPKPSDLQQTGKLYYKGVEIQKLKDFNQLTLLRNLGKHFSDINDNAKPNYYYLNSDNGYRVYPETITEDIQLEYQRVHKIPKWTYTVVNNTPLYNSSAADLQDFELPERFFDNLVIKICVFAGVSIRDAEAIQAMSYLSEKESKKQEEVE